MAVVCASLSAQSSTWGWKPTAALATARSNACAVRLADGRVLVTGGTGTAGAVDAVELFRVEPEETFQTVAQMHSPRSGHACVLLGDGRVLVAGGETGAGAAVEVYNASANEWREMQSMSGTRGTGVTATALPDGRVLIAGGSTLAFEVFNPDSDELQALPVGFGSVRQRHTATLLADGRVLFTGGTSDDAVVGSAEIYDPAVGTLAFAPPLAIPRVGHTATLLNDSRVLIAGGASGLQERSELEVFVPEIGHFQTLESQLETPRQGHIAVFLETNGAVLLAGGSLQGEALGSTEIFEPWADKVTTAGSLTAPRVSIAGIGLEDGRVLAMGGRNANGPTAGCGVLAPTLVLAFSQSRYRPLEIASLKGTAGTSTTPTFAVALSLQRVNLTTGATADASSRLSTRTLTVVGGRVPTIGLVNVTREDIGHEFVLTARTSTGAAAQAKYSARLQPRMVVTPVPPALVGQPVRANVELLADGLPVSMGGTTTLVVGTRSSASIGSGLLTSLTTTMSVCCESAPGTVQVSARHSGNVFLEPASAPSVPLQVGTNVPTLRIAPELIRLQQPSTIRVELGLDPVVRDVKNPPVGTVTLSKNGTAVGTAPLPNAFLFLDSGLQSAVTFTITPTSADRRVTPCFIAQYSGEARYTAATAPQVCAAVAPALTSLQVTLGGPSNYILGQDRTLTAQLTWPDAVGIVGRTVNVTAAGRPIASIALTPDPTGRGIATGSATVKLPFGATGVSFEYPQSGDLSLALNSVRTSMDPISTTTTITARAATSNPFNITYTVRLNTGGVPIPPGTVPGGAVEIFDGTELLASQPLPTLQSGTGITDGTSNTIGFGESLLPTVNGSLSNVIRPLGQRTIRVRYTGSTLLAPSEATTVITVQ